MPQIVQILPAPCSDCQTTSGHDSIGNQPQVCIDGCGEDFERNENFKTGLENARESSRSGPRSDHDDGEEPADDERSK